MKANIQTICVALLWLCMATATEARGQADTRKDVNTDKLHAWQGEVEYLEGQVHLNDLTIELGATVHPESVLRTANDSLCEVHFFDQNIFRVLEKTVVHFNLTQLELIFNIKSGAFAAVFEKLNALEGRSLKVQSPVTAAGIRGTAFFIKVENNASTYVCACNGTLSLSPSGGSEDDAFILQAKHHAARRIVRRGDRTVVETAPLLYHSDEGMNQLAAKINMTINWE